MYRLIKGGLVGIVTGLTGALLAISSLHTALESGVGLPWLFHLRGAIEPPAAVAVVAINGQTGTDLGLGALPRDWPRSIHARLIDALVERGASAIVFDMDFRQPKVPEDDRALADAVARAGRVVLFEYLDGKRQPIFDQQGKERGSVWVESLHQPLPALAQAARGLGPFPLPKLEASVEQFWVFKSSAREAATMPAVALQVACIQQLSRLLHRLKASGARVAHAPAGRRGDRGGRGAARAHAVPQASIRSQSRPVGTGGRRGHGDPAPSLDIGGCGVADGGLLAVLAELYGGPNERYLNFYGPPWTITTVPYQSVIAGKDPNLAPGALDFSGKVVFVGFSDLFDPGQPDRFYTVFTRDDGVDLSGVEIAATAFANLLTDSSLKMLDPWTTVAGLFLFGLLMGATLYLLPATVGVPLAIFLAALYAVAAQLSFSQGDLWLPVATPLLVQFPLALFIGLIAQYLLERGRVEHISQAMSYYLPASVHRELTAKPWTPPASTGFVFEYLPGHGYVRFFDDCRTDEAGRTRQVPERLFRLPRPAAETARRRRDRVSGGCDHVRLDWRSTGSGVRKQPILASLEAAQAIAAFKDRHQMAGAKLRIGMEAGEVYVGARRRWRALRLQHRRGQRQHGLADRGPEQARRHPNPGDPFGGRWIRCRAAAASHRSVPLRGQD